MTNSNDEMKKWISLIKESFDNAQSQRVSTSRRRLVEYLVREGDPAEAVFALNVFNDLGIPNPNFEIDDMGPEFAQAIKQLRVKFGKRAEKLAKQIKFISAQGDKIGFPWVLTDEEAESIDDLWYDGSDAYTDIDNDLMIEELSSIYQNQLDYVENELLQHYPRVPNTR